jgi:Tol biopolymer transport system component/DNA-binding winged helix-turn-helix (wHTH) protein
MMDARRPETAENAVLYAFGDIVVDPARYEVRKAGAAVDLEPKAIDVLLFLVRHPGQLVLKEALLDAVWRDTFVTPNALTRVIAQLRKALDDDAQEARVIETVPRKGYRLIPPVTVTASSPPETAATEQAVPLAPARRRRRVSPIAVAFAAVVVIGVAGWTWLRSSAGTGTPSPALEDLVQLTAAPGFESEPALSSDGKRIAYTSDETGANEIFVRPVGDGAAIQLTSDHAQNSHPAWSPDGAFIAYRSLVKRGIWLVSSLGGTARQIAAHGSDPAWSPDGSTVALSTWEGALAESSTIVAVPAAGGAPRAVTRAGTPLGGHRDPAWSNDGRRIAFWSFDGARGGSLWVIPGEGGDPVRLFDQIYPSAIAFTPDDRMVCWSGFGPRASIGVWCVPAEGAPAAAPVPIVQGVAGISGLSIARDGSVAYAAQQVASDLWSVPLSSATGAPAGDAVPLFEDTWRNSHPAFSPDGKWLAYLNWRPGTPSDLWLMNMQTRKSEFLVPGKTAEFYPTWQPDSRHLLTMTGRGAERRVMRVSIEKRTTEPVAGLPESMSNFALSPDGREIAYHIANEAGRLTVWRVPAGGGPPVRLSAPEDSAGYPVWSPDGARLAIELEESGDTHIYVIDRDGKGKRKVTSGSGQNWPHSWAPDNDRIALAAERAGIWNVSTVAARSGEVRQLTAFSGPNGYVRYPAWSPSNDRIVFERAVTTANLWIARLKGPRTGQ